MKNPLLYIIVFFFCLPIVAQEGFQFKDNKKKVTIRFKFINNLVFIPIKVNDVELNFLLDTGVDETILFSLEDKDELRFNNVEKIKLKGLGSAASIEGLKSSKNTLSIPHLIDNNHDLYIVLDQDFNFSSQVGIPVNGIIGYNFFKNHIIEINYDKKKITIYNEATKKSKKRAARFESFPISIEKHKPYLETTIDILHHKDVPAKLLLDIGNTDAVWLFQNRSKEIELPEKHLADFLGRGFSGDIFGKRARIPNFNINKFNFPNPIVAFPDSTSLANVNFVENRVGSIGSEILKRFTVIFDYQNSKMFLRKGNDFDLPFSYNMSGIEIHHQGLQWVQETVELNPASGTKAFDLADEKIKNDFKYKFSLKPYYSVANVRKDSPGDLCGVKKGDILVSINKYSAYKFSLQQITALLKSEEGKNIELEVDRDGEILKFKFQLKNLL
ncbi:MAG: aspartyl protease family protein [Bacteroidota bacterium]